MTLFKCFLILITLLLVSCAGGPSQKKLNDSNNLLRAGEVKEALISLEESNKKFNKKDLPYFLDKSILLQLDGKQNNVLTQENLIKVDSYIDDWVARTSINLNNKSNDFFSYLYAGGIKNNYEPRDYEKSMISYNLVISHFLDKQFENARVDARKLAERETLIEQINEIKILSTKEQEDKNSKNKILSSSSINTINGYPVDLLNSPEINSLKNSYQNAAAHYLAGFIFEMQGEAGLAAPGYRIATELKPGNSLFVNSLEELDRKIAENNINKSTSEILFIFENGMIPRVSTHKTNLTFNTASGPRIVTIRLPVIEKNNINYFKASSISVNSNSILITEVANLDAMARRQLKDDMPGYMIKATTQAFTQLMAQAAAQAASKKNQKNDNGAGIFAALLVGAVMSVGDVDERSWSSLPSSIHMGRTEIPKGKVRIVIPTPNGLQNVDFNATDNYHVIRVRYLGNKTFLSY